MVLKSPGAVTGLQVKQRDPEYIERKTVLIRHMAQSYA